MFIQKCEIIVKKSRFVSYVQNINLEEQAKTFINQISCENKRARHIAFAYIVENIIRHSDAGEPRGTAGTPILSAIQRRGICNVVVVVVRYFGGILLGKGGLIRAYGKAAGLSLDESLQPKI